MGYFGYALQAGVKGFQTGFNMAQQKSEMEWQKKKKKELEEKELKIKEGAALYSSLVSQVYADNIISEDEMMKLNTAYLAAGYEVQAVIKDTHNAIQTMDKNKIEQDLAWLDLFADMTEGLDPKDTQGTFDMIKGNIKSEKGINLFDAYGSLQTKKYEVSKEKEPWEKAAVLPSEVRVPFLEQEGVEMPEVPTTTEPLSVAGRKFNMAMMIYEKNKNLDMLLKYLGMDVTPEKKSVLKEKLDEMDRLGVSLEEKKNWILGKGGGTTTPTAFKTLESIKDSFKNVKTKAEYDSALQSYNASKEAKTSGWTPPPWEDSLTELIKKVESALWSDYVNKKGKLKSKNEADEYNARLQHYLKLIEEAKSVGLDVSQFQAFIPYKSLYGGIGDPLVTSESW